MYSESAVYPMAHSAAQVFTLYLIFFSYKFCIILLRSWHSMRVRQTFTGRTKISSDDLNFGTHFVCTINCLDGCFFVFLSFTKTTIVRFHILGVFCFTSAN